MHGRLPLAALLNAVLHFYQCTYGSGSDTAIICSASIL
jgi:hypothetical protein